MNPNIYKKKNLKAKPAIHDSLRNKLKKDKARLP